MLSLFGDIAHISGVRSALDNGVEWQYVLAGQTASGVLFNAKNSTRAILDNTARIFGSKGWAELPEYWKARSVTFHIDGKSETVSFPCEHELSYEAAHIDQCISRGLLTSPVVTPELSVGGIAVLESVQRQWGL